MEDTKSAFEIAIQVAATEDMPFYFTSPEGVNVEFNVVTEDWKVEKKIGSSCMVYGIPSFIFKGKEGRFIIVNSETGASIGEAVNEHDAIGKAVRSFGHPDIDLSIQDMCDNLKAHGITLPVNK